MVGLTKQWGERLSDDVSTTITRNWTSIWFAARPIPGAAYMVSNMSSIRVPKLASKLVTAWALSRRRGSGWCRICRRAMLVPEILNAPQDICKALITQQELSFHPNRYGTMKSIYFQLDSAKLH